MWTPSAGSFHLEFRGIFNFPKEENGLCGSVDQQQQEGPIEADDGVRGAVLRADYELGGRGRCGFCALLADVQHGLVGGLPREKEMSAAPTEAALLH